jgi:hypothetical protein
MAKKELLPGTVYRMCVHGAFIAGSYAKKLVGEGIDPSDIDLLVPLDKWTIIAPMIPKKAKMNKFGGWRFKEKGIEIDVWPDTVENYLTKCKTKHDGLVVVVDYINNRYYTSGMLKE